MVGETRRCVDGEGATKLKERKGMELTESLVRTKSSILTCKLAESFGLSSFFGRAMLSTPSPWLSSLFRWGSWGMKTGGLVIKVVI